MKIDVLFTAVDAETFNFSGQIAIIIDVLRATTTMTAALEGNVTAVFPALTIDDAFAIRTVRPGVLLCGEREGFRIEGFDYGNSPVAIREAPVQGREIVLTTTNGTRAVIAARNAKHIVAGAIRNASATAEYVSQYIKAGINDEAGEIEGIVVVCSGTNGRFSVDDVYAAGLVVAKLGRIAEVMSDSAHASLALVSKSVSDVVNRRTCRHVRLLEDIGFGMDVEYAFQVDTSDIVPIFINDAFRKPG
jgi:2-phosphosulfolactate phosphatase